MADRHHIPKSSELITEDVDMAELRSLWHSWLWHEPPKATITLRGGSTDLKLTWHIPNVHRKTLVNIVGPRTWSPPPGTSSSTHLCRYLWIRLQLDRRCWKWRPRPPPSPGSTTSPTTITESCGLHHELTQLFRRRTQGRQLACRLPPTTTSKDSQSLGTPPIWAFFGGMRCETESQRSQTSLDVSVRRVQPHWRDSSWPGREVSRTTTAGLAACWRDSNPAGSIL